MDSAGDNSGAVPGTVFVAEFARCQAKLQAYIRSLLPNRADAEDVFQKTSMTLWRKFDQWEPERGVFEAWACGVAFYEVRQFRRTSSRSRLYFDDELMELLSEERQVDLKSHDERLEALEQCRGKLKERDQLLLQEIYDRGYGVVELAEKQGSAVQTLYNRLNQIRRQLYFCMQKNMEVEA